MRMLYKPHHLPLADSRQNPAVGGAAGAVEAYLAGLAESSHRTARQSLDVVAAYLTGSEKATAERVQWYQLRRDDMADLRKILAKHYAPATANKMLSIVRGVLRACANRKLMSLEDAETAAGISNVPDIYHPNPEELRLVGHDELEALLAACGANHSPAGRRDAALLAILLGTGLRRAEAIALDLSDFNMKRIDRATLHIRGDDADRNRLVHLARQVAEHIRDWIDLRGDEPGPLLLPVNKSGVIADRRMTDQAVYDIVRRLAIRANVPHITTRALRRTYVASLIASGLPLETVRELAGHASWVTTSAYAELADEIATHDPLPLERFLPRATEGHARKGAA